MNANDSLSHFNCTEHYYNYNLGFLLTDGTKELATQFECYWLFDIIVSYRMKLHKENFQVWSLKKHANNTAMVICTDGNDKTLIEQYISFTDFKADEATVWVEDNIILLPSEH